MRLILVLLAVAFLWVPRKSIAANPAFTFASDAQAKAILTARDEFVQRMSPFDRGARLKTDADVNEAAYLAFAGAQATTWSDAEKAPVQAVLADLNPRPAQYVFEKQVKALADSLPPSQKEAARQAKVG